MDRILLHVLNGVTFGGILFLLASGLSLIFGVMGILNLAHGALFMVGAYVGWTISVAIGWNFFLAIVIGGLAAAAVGVVLERGFLRHLYKNIDDQALLTLGVVFILENLTQWIWGPTARPAFVPPSLSGSVTLGPISYPASRLSIIGMSVIIALALWTVDRRTQLGARIRAGRDDKEMLTGLGINFDRVAMGVFALGAFIAGLGGVIGGQVLGVNRQLALSILLLAVVVVVVGGIGSVSGSFVGAMVIGVIDSFGRAFFPDLALFTIYLAMVLILILKPTGLLGGRV